MPETQTSLRSSVPFWNTTSSSLRSLPPHPSPLLGIRPVRGELEKLQQSERRKDTLRRGGSCWEEVLIINKRRGEVVEVETETGKGSGCSVQRGPKKRRPKAFSLSIKFSKSAHELAAAICGEPFSQQSPVSQQQPQQMILRGKKSI